MELVKNLKDPEDKIEQFINLIQNTKTLHGKNLVNALDSISKFIEDLPANNKTESLLVLISNIDEFKDVNHDFLFKLIFKLIGTVMPIDDRNKLRHAADRAILQIPIDDRYIALTCFLKSIDKMHAGEKGSWLKSLIAHLPEIPPANHSYLYKHLLESINALTPAEKGDVVHHLIFQIDKFKETDRLQVFQLALQTVYYKTDRMVKDLDTEYPTDVQFRAEASEILLEAPLKQVTTLHKLEFLDQGYLINHLLTYIKKLPLNSRNKAFIESINSIRQLPLIDKKDALCEILNTAIFLPETHVDSKDLNHEAVDAFKSSLKDIPKSDAGILLAFSINDFPPGLRFRVLHEAIKWSSKLTRIDRLFPIDIMSTQLYSLKPEDYLQAVTEITPLLKYYSRQDLDGKFFESIMQELYFNGPNNLIVQLRELRRQALWHASIEDARKSLGLGPGEADFFDPDTGGRNYMAYFELAIALAGVAQSSFGVYIAIKSNYFRIASTYNKFKEVTWSDGSKTLTSPKGIVASSPKTFTPNLSNRILPRPGIDIGSGRRLVFTRARFRNVVRKLNSPRDRPAFNSADTARPVQPRNLPKSVFRGDSRPPGEIYANGGFNPKGDDPSLYNHLNGGHDSSGYVSVSRSCDRAKYFATGFGPDKADNGYIYELKTPQLDESVRQNWLDVHERYPKEVNNEIAIKGSISSNEIVRIYEVNYVKSGDIMVPQIVNVYKPHIIH